MKQKLQKKKIKLLSCLILKIFVFISLTIDNKKAIKKKRC